MLLKQINLSGFKSFVDVTHVKLPSSLVGIVGPNGCGKSNVIDAVRWVMGESSAKTLRGDAMTDVIFNGASSRKPTNQASVEMIFDNSDQSLLGEYAAYQEISVRRVVDRESQSHYFLNGTRCRRKDIAGLFLGTGLGPRSYSIIQQGTVSRLVEAKPEELRAFLEEAAGISKYKERRRETGNRIRHTRENMMRLQDIRSELEDQLARLHRQAEAAKRYQTLKETQHQAQASLLGLKWQSCEEHMAHDQKSLHQQETDIEQAIAGLRKTQADIEQQREEQITCNENYHLLQRKVYELKTAINKLEQAIHYQQERKQQLTLDFDQTVHHLTETNEALKHDQAELCLLEEKFSSLSPRSEAVKAERNIASAALQTAESDMHQWQEAWDCFNDNLSQKVRQAEVEKTHMVHAEKQMQITNQRVSQLETQKREIDVEAFDQSLARLATEKMVLEQKRSDQNKRKAQLADQVTAALQQLEQENIQLDQYKQAQQVCIGKIASLEALQQSALETESKQATEWLSQHFPNEKTYLGQMLDVMPGWERAVEVVLAKRLQSICMNELTAETIKSLADLAETTLTITQLQPVDASLVKPGTLQSTLRSPYMIPELNKVYMVNSVEQALEKLHTIAMDESVITAEGLWVTQQWVQSNRASDPKQGIIAREKQLKSLYETKKQHRLSIEQSDEKIAAFKAKQAEYTGQQATCQVELTKLESQYASLLADEKLQRGKQADLHQKAENMCREHNQLLADAKQYEETFQHSRDQWQKLMSEVEEQSQKKNQLVGEKAACVSALASAQQALQKAMSEQHESELLLQSTQTQKTALTQAINRLSQQSDRLQSRKQEIHDTLSENIQPIDQLLKQNEALRAEHIERESEFARSKVALDEINATLITLEKDRQSQDSTIQQLKQNVESKRVAIEGFAVRQKMHVEQMDEMQLSLEQVLAFVNNEDTIESVESALAQLQRKIDRLGPINLMAMDECEEKQQRKQYLDAQAEDLEAALQTLENAIAKIDKETREKFQETYQIVDQQFQQLFPKIFGGGSANLALTSDDWLDTGVSVMARPPGKRNTTIHLLSGGEKAMTAIALVFSIFHLNPAPFCMLDEVDAPLDDANVVRYCELIKEMSTKVQFIVITHNKLTMEAMNQLMGVTMAEPGVSRLVSVNVDQAADMAVA